MVQMLDMKLDTPLPPTLLGAVWALRKCLSCGRREGGGRWCGTWRQGLPPQRRLASVRPGVWQVVPHHRRRPPSPGRPAALDTWGCHRHREQLVNTGQTQDMGKALGVALMTHRVTSPLPTWGGQVALAPWDSWTCRVN